MAARTNAFVKQLSEMSGSFVVLKGLLVMDDGETVDLRELLGAYEDQERARKYREAARRLYARDGEIEVDDEDIVSFAEDGAYVQAWVWVGEDNLRE